MHAFIFLVLMTPSSGGGIWNVSPCLIQMFA